jgi:hypothetical protein
VRYVKFGAVASSKFSTREKSVKKFVSLALVLALGFGIVGCGSPPPAPPKKAPEAEKKGDEKKGDEKKEGEAKKEGEGEAKKE